MAKIDDARLVAMISSGVGMAVGFADSKLSKEREEVQRYKDGEKPYKAHSGDTKYNSYDLFESVEQMKSVLLEVFSGNSRPVVFTPANGEDVAAAEIRTEYCTNVIFSQNKGFSIVQATIEDGLMNRAGIVKVWWETKHTTEHYDLANTTYEEIAAFLSKNPTAEIKEVEGTQDGTKFKRVRLSIKKDRSQVRIKVLAPEQFGISPMAEDIESADLVFHREPMTVSKLLKQGYDKKTIMALNDSDRFWLSTEPEIMQRFGQTDDMIGMHGLEDGQKSNREIMVFEAYLEIADDDEEGEQQLTKVIMAGDQILSREPVDRKPFVAFIPLPKPHAFWGTNFAKMIIPTQNSRTYLTRAVINHALISTNPRVMVAKGGLLNPRELVENRFGGIVNVKSLEQVAPFPQASLNPFVLQIRQSLLDDKEQITGTSAMSAGLNKDVLSKQNSQELVQDVTTAGQTRQRIVARNFAECFLRELYMLVYRLVLENEDRERIVAIAGNWTPVDFTQWPEDTEMEVSFSLGLNEMKQEATKWMGFDKYMASDPMLHSFYPPPKRFAVLKKAMEATGIKNITDYILTPDQVPPPTPSPTDQAHLAVLQADAQVKVASAKATEAKTQLDAQQLQMKTQEALAKMQLQTTKATSDEQLKRDTLAHKVAVDAAEIGLEQEALAQGGAKLTAQASATR